MEDLFGSRVNGQDLLLHQLHGSGPLGDLLIKIISQSGPLQLHLCGLEGRFSLSL